MRIAVIGAGGTFGGRLARAGVVIPTTTVLYSILLPKANARS